MTNKEMAKEIAEELRKELNCDLSCPIFDPETVRGIKMIAGLYSKGKQTLVFTFWGTVFIGIIGLFLYGAWVKFKQIMVN